MIALLALAVVRLLIEGDVVYISWDQSILNTFLRPLMFDCMLIQWFQCISF